MAAPSASVEELVRQSTFVFRGTVQRLNAATMPAVPVNPHTAVVRVDEIIHAPTLLTDLTNQEITVQLREDPPIEGDQQAVFFTNPWLYGTGVAVQEVARRPIGTRGAEAERNRLREEVSSVAQRLPDEELRRHLAAAELVVVGTVYDTRPAGAARSRQGTEHDPQWWEARIAVEELLKGILPPPNGQAPPSVPAEPTVTALFANSMDVRWFQAPKLRPGQEGIWLLHREDTFTVPSAHYAVLDSLDVHPKDQAQRLLALLRPADIAASAPETPAEQ